MSATGLDSAAAQPHRRDIDGLRALAVLIIVVFHAVPALAPGGFVGVDVFFVISGFLITRIIAGEREAGVLSFARFYLRRARRILPAYVVVTAIVAAAGYALLMPRELQNFGWGLGGSGVFATNVVFAKTGGYFEPLAEQSPLLHLWSLAVEEQFYLVWPLLLAGLSVARLRRARLALVLVLAVLSLSAAQFVVASGDPRAAFFHLPFRAWEFLLGAALTLGVPPPRTPALASAALVAGLVMILGSVAGLSTATPFPGLSALPAALGAALAIWGGGLAGPVAAPLRWSPVVGLGLISYSLYLWHWPLLVFARLLAERPLTAAEGLAIAVASAGLARLTWRFVEQPWRGQAPAPRLRHLALGAAPLAIILGLGAAALAGAGLPGRLPPRVAEAAAQEERDVNPRRAACFDGAFQARGTPAACRPQGPVQVLVWGDSHGDAMTPGVAVWAARRGYGLQQSTGPGCPPLSDVRAVIMPARVNPLCGPMNASVLRDIARAPDLKLIVLAARWPLYAEAKPDYDINSPRVRVEDAKGPRGRVLPLDAALDRTLTAIAATGTRARVVVVGPVPELTFTPAICVARKRLLGLDEHLCDSAPSAGPLARATIAEGLISKALAKHPGVAMTRPADQLCHDGRCVTVLAGTALYFDDDHLSASGARRLVPGWLDAALSGP